MVAASPPTGSAEGFEGTRQRDPVSEYIRIGLGVAILLILVLSGLAFINSFFLEPPAPSGPRGNRAQEKRNQGKKAEEAAQNGPANASSPSSK